MLSEETKRRIAAANVGKRLSAETRRKLSEAFSGERHPNYGKHLPLSTRRKISEGSKGKKHSEEARRNMSEAKKGSRNGSWRGGISFLPYLPEFNQTLKVTIRERDGFTCQLCGALEDGQAHCIHHCDYDKSNNEPENLITLCNGGGCHPRTGINRAFYTNLFQARMKMGLRRK